MVFCESGEIHRWLNLLGEHVDLYEVEKQILSSSNADNDEDGTGETLSRDKYAALVAEGTDSLYWIVKLARLSVFSVFMCRL